VTFSNSTLSILAVVAVAIAVIAFVWVIVLGVRVRAMRRQYLALQGPDGTAESFVEAVSRKIDEVTALREDVGELRARIQQARVELGQAVRHVSVIRYDAFGDMGGRLSFSIALLDDGGDGLVMSSINGRTETRTYVKPVQAARSEQTLSPEEIQAITEAMQTPSESYA
jgi:Protein of unknown function (DUF4446)